MKVPATMERARPMGWPGRAEKVPKMAQWEDGSMDKEGKSGGLALG